MKCEFSDQRNKKSRPGSGRKMCTCEATRVVTFRPHHCPLDHARSVYKACVQHAKSAARRGYAVTRLKNFVS